MTPAERAIDRVVETTRVTERVLEPAPARATAATLDFRPAPATPSPTTAPSLATDRIVHVRIGAIEIHGAAATPAAPVPAPTAPAPSAALAVVGFDAFTRLRSYAPWDW